MQATARLPTNRFRWALVFVKFPILDRAAGPPANASYRWITSTARLLLYKKAVQPAIPPRQLSPWLGSSGELSQDKQRVGHCIGQFERIVDVVPEVVHIQQFEAGHVGQQLGDLAG